MRLKIIFGFEILLVLMFMCITYYKHLQFVHKYDTNKWIKLLKRKHKILEFIKNYIGCFIIIILSLIVFLIILNSPYGLNSDLLAAYCSFLTFVGTFMIGYYIHKKEMDSKRNIRKNKCLRLGNAIMTTYISVKNLDNVKSQKHKIIYDTEWYTYMIDYIESSNTNKVYDIYEALSTFFNCVDCINIELEQKNIEKAIKIRDDYEEEQFYLPIRYNVFDILCDIEDYNTLNEIGKYEKNEIINFIRNIYSEQYIKTEDLKEYIEKYFCIVELLIYNEVIKNGQADIFLTNKKIIDELKANKYLQEQILNKLKHYSPKMVSIIVWEISDEIDSRSKIIEKKNNYYIIKNQ